MIHLPVFQKFDCHSCAGCCRDIVVDVSEQERKKILDSGWAERLAGPLFVSYRAGGRRRMRLAQRPDGRCVFLDDDRRCRLHAESGAGVKPLGCRLYPFVLVPGAEDVRLDLRADCPSVAANRGRGVRAHADEICRMASEAGARPVAGTWHWDGSRVLTPAEFRGVIDVFDRILTVTGSYRARLFAGARLLDLLYQVRIHKVHDERLADLLELLLASALDEGEAPLPGGAVPPRAGRLFRQWLYLHGWVVNTNELTGGFFSHFQRSWRRYAQARGFALGQGGVPRLRDADPATTFDDVAAVAPAPEEALEPVCRSMRVKLQSHAFAGPAYYGHDVLRGLTALWLIPALVGWFARLEAVGRGTSPEGVPRSGAPALTREDVLAGVMRTHRTFGVSPVFARISERIRLKALAQPGVPSALLAAYGP